MRRGLPAGQLDRQPAELCGKRNERSEDLEIRLVDDRDVDRVRDEPSLERRHDLLGDDHAGPVLRLVRRRREMRRHDDGVEPEQRTVVRLGGEHVQSRACELAGLERLRERLLVDERTPGGVDESGAVLHLRDRLAVDHPARLVGQRGMQREEVRHGEHRGDVVRVLDADSLEPLVGDERVVGDDLHPEPYGATGYLLADPAETEDAERLALQLDASPLRPLPTALLQCGVRLWDVARERDHEADRLLGGGDDCRLRSVDDDDPAAGRRLHVDVVHSDPGAPDHLQIRGAFDEIRGELRRGANHDRVVALDDLLERCHLVLVDVEPRPEKLDPRFGDRLANEHPHRSDALSRRRRGPRPRQRRVRPLRPSRRAGARSLPAP